MPAWYHMGVHPIDDDLIDVLPPGAGVDDAGRLVLGGVDVTELAARFGTPLYVYDEATIRAACRAYVEAFVNGRTGNHVHYAAKAYLAPWLCRLLREEGMGLDVVSGGELHVALTGGVPAGEIRMHGNNKPPGELRDAIAAGIGRIVVDNHDELSLLQEIAAEMDRRVPILLRLSPGVEAHTHEYLKTGLLDSKFGLPIATGDALRAVRRALASPNLDLRGYHAHVGTGLFDPEPVAEGLRRLLRFARVAREETGYWPREISPGSGLGIAYTRGERAPSVAALAAALDAVLTEDSLQHTGDHIGSAGFQPAPGCRLEAGAPSHNTLSDATPSDPTYHRTMQAEPTPAISVEPGRSIIGRAGVALYTVGARKSIAGVREYVAVDGGMADNIRPTLYGATYTALAATRMREVPAGPVTVAGRYCESGDVLVRDAPLPALEPGDLIAVPASGAYCLPMSSLYNAAARPAVVVVSDGRARLAQRRGTVADVLAYDVM